MNKFLTMIAGVGMLAAAEPALAQHHWDNQPRAGVTFHIGVGDNGRRYYQNNHDWRLNQNYRFHRHYRYVPTCFGNEVAVESPYYAGGYVCVERDDLSLFPRYR